jgi:hypothetical protein
VAHSFHNGLDATCFKVRERNVPMNTSWWIWTTCTQHMHWAQDAVFNYIWSRDQAHKFSHAIHNGTIGWRQFTWITVILVPVTQQQTVTIKQDRI